MLKTMQVKVHFLKHAFRKRRSLYRRFKFLKCRIWGPHRNCKAVLCWCARVWKDNRRVILQLPVQERPAHIQASLRSGSVNLPRKPINYLLEVPASWPAITSCHFLWVFPSFCQCVLLRERPPTATFRRRDPLSLFMQARRWLMKTDFECRHSSARFEQDSAHVGFEPPHKLTFS